LYQNPSLDGFLQDLIDAQGHRCPTPEFSSSPKLFIWEALSRGIRWRTSSTVFNAYWLEKADYGAYWMTESANA